MSTCTFILTQGKNKGQMCGDVNKRCRHNTKTCERCGKDYQRDTSFAKHIKMCTEKIKINVVKPKEESMLFKELHELRQKLDQQTEKMEHIYKEIQEKPTVINNNNISTVINCKIVVGNNFYDELVTKMGRDEALKFLIDVVSKNTPIDIISKLYLEDNDPDDFPISCKDKDHFRYVDSERNLVDDKGGHKIVSMIINNTQNALLEASNIMIRQQVASDDEVNGLHDNFGMVQIYACDINKRMPTRKTKENLSKVTENPLHPFFKKGDVKSIIIV